MTRNQLVERRLVAGPQPTEKSRILLHAGADANADQVSAERVATIS